jgi:predicted MFS family arabinose efflux permease
MRAGNGAGDGDFRLRQRAGSAGLCGAKSRAVYPGAVDVASGLNIAAFNVGIALGSIVGGQTVERYGLAQTPWIGAMIVLVALLLVVLSGRLDKLPRRSAAVSPEG